MIFLYFICFFTLFTAISSDDFVLAKKYNKSLINTYKPKKMGSASLQLFIKKSIKKTVDGTKKISNRLFIQTSLVSVNAQCKFTILSAAISNKYLIIVTHKSTEMITQKPLQKSISLYTHTNYNNFILIAQEKMDDNLGSAINSVQIFGDTIEISFSDQKKTIALTKEPVEDNGAVNLKIKTRHLSDNRLTHTPSSLKKEKENDSANHDNQHPEHGNEDQEDDEKEESNEENKVESENEELDKENEESEKEEEDELEKEKKDEEAEPEDQNSDETIDEIMTDFVIEQGLQDYAFFDSLKSIYE